MGRVLLVILALDERVTGLQHFGQDKFLVLAGQLMDAVNASR
jgi:hypothetical protein